MTDLEMYTRFDEVANGKMSLSNEDYEVFRVWAKINNVLYGFNKNDKNVEVTIL